MVIPPRTLQQKYIIKRPVRWSPLRDHMVSVIWPALFSLTLWPNKVAKGSSLINAYTLSKSSAEINI